MRIAIALSESGISYIRCTESHHAAFDALQNAADEVLPTLEVDWTDDHHERGSKYASWEVFGHAIDAHGDPLDVSAIYQIDGLGTVTHAYVVIEHAMEDDR